MAVLVVIAYGIPVPRVIQNAAHGLPCFRTWNAHAQLLAFLACQTPMAYPRHIVAAVVGDGEAETGPLAGSWQGINFLNPARDGAVLPILHLNGFVMGV